MTVNDSALYKKVLLTPPTFYDVIHQGLNCYMTLSQPVDRSKAMDQWNELKNTLSSYGVEVKTCPAAKGCVDMVFAANGALVLNHRALVSKMAAQPRQQESEHFTAWFREQGFETEKLENILSKNDYFEGAAEFSPSPDGKKFYFGWGYRATKGAVDSVMKFFQLSKDEVIEVQLVDERFYHLDVCLSPLSQNHMLVYPGAFTEDSYQAIKDSVENESILIEISEEEACQFSCNSVSFVSDKNENVVIAQKLSPRLKTLLTELGYKCIELDYSEYMLGGGSIRCTVLDIGM